MSIRHAYKTGGEEERKARYVAASTKAREWGLSVRRIRYLCAQHLVFRAVRDNVTGEWRIPQNAEHPIDRRAYRYRKVPVHLHDLVQHADVALKTEMEKPKRTAEESWQFFCQGSAYHMHTIYPSTLRFCDVCAIVQGWRVEGRDLDAQERVVRHIKALNHIRKAAEGKRRLSMTLVREILRLIVQGKRPRALSVRHVDDLANLLLRINAAHDHPLIRAGDVLDGLCDIDPYLDYSEILGYLLANFILMRAGYPPAILYRIIFLCRMVYQHQYREMVADCDDPRFLPPPPARRRAFLCACLIRAVARSCRLGIRPIVTPRPASSK